MIDVITEEDLQRLMRLKAEEEIYDIFLWNEGDFQFIDDELPQMEMIPLQVDVTGMIMEGTRRVDEWNRIHTLIGHEGLVPSIVKELPPEELDDDAQRTVVNAIDGKRSLAELVLESRSSSFNVASTSTHLDARRLREADRSDARSWRRRRRSRGRARAVRGCSPRTTRSCR